MPRIPRIKFPQRHPPKSSAAPPTSDQHLFVPQSAKLQPKEPATKTGEGPSYRFRSDVPAPPSNTALGGKASLLPKRTPLSEEEIEAIMHIVMCNGWYAAAWVVDGCIHDPMADHNCWYVFFKSKQNSYGAVNLVGYQFGPLIQ